MAIYVNTEQYSLRKNKYIYTCFESLTRGAVPPLSAKHTHTLTIRYEEEMELLADFHNNQYAILSPCKVEMMQLEQWK